MNHLATSKDDILAASRELIKDNGWTAVSIRAVASRCSVSAGTIYNYYESKSDLLGDTIESIYLGFKREFSKLIGFLVVALIAVGLVFNAGGVKDVLLELFNKIIGA